MHLQYHCQYIATSSLSLSSSWDIHPYLESSEPILQSAPSINSLGLMYIPLVLAKDDGGFEAVTGMRAVATFLDLQVADSIPCRVLPQSTTAEAILNSVYEEYSRGQDGLTAIEMAHFHALCTSKLAGDRLAPFYRGMSLPAKPHTIRRALDLLQLSRDMQAAMSRDFLPENVARELLRLTPDDREACFQLFVQLQIGGGKQRRLLFLLRDLAGRKGCSITEFLDSPAVKDILDHREMNRPQKTHSLLQQLQRLQSPSLAAAEEQFDRWLAQLSLADNCTVEHSTSFEQDNVSLRISFNNPGELAEALPEINALLQKLSR